MNAVETKLEEAVGHLRRAKAALLQATDLTLSSRTYAPVIDDMIGVVPRLGDLIVDVMGAARTAKECEP